MDINASAYYIRVAPRKMDLLVKTIKGLEPAQAVVTLRHVNKSGSLPLKKVIDSAIANAKDKHADTQNLTFKSIIVLQGSSMKRFHAVSKGMAHGYKKRMTHVKVVLTDAAVKKQTSTVKKDAAQKEAIENPKSEILNPKQIQNTNT